MRCGSQPGARHLDHLAAPQHLMKYVILLILFTILFKWLEDLNT